MVIVVDKDWIPPKDLGKETLVYDDNYIDCAYYSVLIIFGSDVLPVTDTELLFVGIVLVIGGLVKNYIFASMTILVDSMMS